MEERLWDQRTDIRHAEPVESGECSQERAGAVDVGTSLMTLPNRELALTGGPSSLTTTCSLWSEATPQPRSSLRLAEARLPAEKSFRVAPADHDRRTGCWPSGVRCRTALTVHRWFGRVFYLSYLLHRVLPAAVLATTLNPSLALSSLRVRTNEGLKDSQLYHISYLTRLTLLACIRWSAS